MMTTRAFLFGWSIAGLLVHAEQISEIELAQKNELASKQRAQASLKRLEDYSASMESKRNNWNAMENDLRHVESESSAADGQLQDKKSSLEAHLKNTLARIEAVQMAVPIEAYSTAACQWRQTGGCSPAGDREPKNDKACTVEISVGNSGFCDCNGDGVKNALEGGYGCGASPGTCQAMCQTLTVKAKDRTAELQELNASVRSDRERLAALQAQERSAVRENLEKAKKNDLEHVHALRHAAYLAAKAWEDDSKAVESAKRSAKGVDKTARTTQSGWEQFVPQFTRILPPILLTKSEQPTASERAKAHVEDAAIVAEHTVEQLYADEEKLLGSQQGDKVATNLMSAPADHFVPFIVVVLFVGVFAFASAQRRIRAGSQMAQPMLSTVDA